MTVVLTFGGAVLGIAALLLVARIALGPTMLDRVVALDVLVAAMICALGLEAAIHQHTTTLPILGVLSLLGFVGSVSVARFTRGSDNVEADHP